MKEVICIKEGQWPSPISEGGRNNMHGPKENELCYVITEIIWGNYTFYELNEYQRQSPYYVFKKVMYNAIYFVDLDSIDISEVVSEKEPIICMSNE